jgi:hypothetical protein
MDPVREDASLAFALEGGECSTYCRIFQSELPQDAQARTMLDDDAYPLDVVRTARLPTRWHPPQRMLPAERIRSSQRFARAAFMKSPIPVSPPKIPSMTTPISNSLVMALSSRREEEHFPCQGH